jgi:hypothetical protein
LKVKVIEGSSAIMLAALVLASFFLVGMPLAHADTEYTVYHPSFVDPYYPRADLNHDTIASSKDVTIFVDSYNAYGAGGWIPAGDLNGDGMVNSHDVTMFVDSYYWCNSPGYVFDTPAPVANSDYLSMNVPQRPAATVWDCLFVKFYVPQAIANHFFLLVATNPVGGALRNIQVDAAMKDSSQHTESYPSIFLGQFSTGYHLLLFEFREPNSGDGSLSLGIGENQTQQTAQIDRTRILVPSYSGDEVSYTITTQTYFPNSQDFFLCGNTSRSITNIMYNGATRWYDWMWSVSQSDVYYGWGDGFMYPIGNDLIQNVPVPMQFVFHNVGSGMLDFQYIAQESQSNLVGQPKYYASVSPLKNVGSHITTNSLNLYGGSKWEAAAGLSRKNITAQAVYAVNYNDGTNWFNTNVSFSVGNWWSTWRLDGSQPPDIGIPLNMTVLDFNSSLPVGEPYYDWWDFKLTNYSLNLSSFSNLCIAGMENGQFQSNGIINQDYTAATDFAGNIILSSLVFSTSPITIAIGSLVGLSVSGIGTAFALSAGQQISRYNQVGGGPGSTNVQLVSTQDMLSEISNQGVTSSNDLVFIGLSPGSGMHCGLTKIVLAGTLTATYNHWLITHSSTCFPIGDVEITLYVPWFIWG